MKRNRRVEFPLSSFGKGIWNSVAVNFGRSGRDHCDTSCTLHPKNPANGPKCYAERLEGRRPSVVAKLGRLSRSSLERLCGALGRQLEQHGKDCPFSWIRVSSAGSLPQPAKLIGPHNRGKRKALVGLFRAMVAMVGANRIHVPVESKAKATYYRRLLGKLGIVVRRSCQSTKEWTSERGAASRVISGPNRAAKLVRAGDAIAARKQATGRIAIVCPAIVGNSKCGKCRACAHPDVDIVYLAH